MTRYTISHRKPHLRFVAIQCQFDVQSQEFIQLQLPAWRPGRYELGNFAQNIRKFSVSNEKGQKLCFEKLSKDSWKVFCGHSKTVVVNYEYYANQLNAGSTWIEDEMLYVNPVNCLLYNVERIDENCVLKLNIPDNFKVAIGLPQTDEKARIFIAEDYHQLADSPFIASPDLQHHGFSESGVYFHLWFQGECFPNLKLIEEDFKKFIRHQVKAFGTFPTQEYHFLFHIPGYSHYHGVEHLNSTVIVIGPASQVFTSRLYEEFLSISSHELYHAWNIKCIRPKTMLPYDYKQENYTFLGYVIEGVTTYYGELCLTGAKVLSEQWFYEEIENWINKYLQNYGRENYSVADSSFDTWLDGYRTGIPHRKVSIYNEGALLALLADLVIIKYSDGKNTIDDVMKALYERFGKRGIGYTATDYKTLLEEFSGQSFDAYFLNYIYGTENFLSEFSELLSDFGLSINLSVSKNFSESHYGFKATEKNGAWIVAEIAPNSPAHLSGLVVGDEIFAVNFIKTDSNFQSTLAMYPDSITFNLFSDAKMKTVSLKPKEDFYFPTSKIIKSENTGNASWYRKWIFRA